MSLFATFHVRMVRYFPDLAFSDFTAVRFGPSCSGPAISATPETAVYL